MGAMTSRRPNGDASMPAARRATTAVNERSKNMALGSGGLDRKWTDEGPWRVHRWVDEVEASRARMFERRVYIFGTHVTFL